MANKKPRREKNRWRGDPNKGKGKSEKSKRGKNLGKKMK